MDAISLLKDDHRGVNELFAAFERHAESNRAAKQRADVAKQIITALAVHAAIEEQVFYPYVRRLNEPLGEQILRSLEEHHVVKWLLSELEGLSPTSERFTAKMFVLIETVRHHVEEEEEELFPDVQARVDEEQLRRLGELLESAKKVAPTRPHPSAPDEPPGNLIAGAGASLLDRARHAGRELARVVTGKRGESAEAKAIRKATGTRPARLARRVAKQRDQATRQAKKVGRRAKRAVKRRVSTQARRSTKRKTRARA